MNNLFIIYETYTNGYRTDILDILSLLAILCGILVIISKNPIVSVRAPFWIFFARESLKIHTYVLLIRVTYYLGESRDFTIVICIRYKLYDLPTIERLEGVQHVIKGKNNSRVTLNEDSSRSNVFKVRSTCLIGADTNPTRRLNYASM